MTAPTTPSQAFSADAFAAFWADPKPEHLTPDAFVEDVVGLWPDAVLHGVEAYTGRLKELLDLLPDMRLEVAEHADNGDHVFVRWIMRATGRRGAFELHGVDRIRTEGGLIAENLIVFDTRRFEELSGYALPL